MVKEEGKFKWLEEGTKGQPIILLHGLMGGVETVGLCQMLMVIMFGSSLH